MEKIKFMCVHDIGHFMFSHAMESIVGDENCDHEAIGQKILKEDEEIKEALEKIQAKEENSNLEGDGSLETLCEGNIDFDRMDFSLRDRVYIGEKYLEDVILNLDFMCDLKWVEAENAYRYVYKEEALPYIEKFLIARDEMYQKEYKSKERIIGDEISIRLVNEIKNGEIQSCLKHIIGRKLEEIDVDEYLKTNDIVFLNQLLKKRKELEKDKILHYAIPDNQTLLQIAINLLDPKNTDFSEYSQEEKEFLKNLKVKLAQKDNLAKDDLEDIVTLVQLDEDKREEIQEKIQEILEISENAKGIYSYEEEYKKYKKEEPIYIEEKGRIITLDQHSKLQMDLSARHVYGIFCILSELEEQGFNEQKISQVQAVLREYQKEEKEPVSNKIEKSRMNMFQTRHGGVNYENEFYKFFEEEEI